MTVSSTAFGTDLVRQDCCLELDREVVTERHEICEGPAGSALSVSHRPQQRSRRTQKTLPLPSGPAVS